MSTATAQGVRRWWDADGGWSTADAAGTVLVIDSWLVDEGRVRGLDRHAERFGSACDRFSEPGAEQTNRFLRAVAKSLPARGRWFPRVELVKIGSGTRLRMWLRPAPPRTATVRVAGTAGQQVVTEQATAPDLAGVPVWTLNALHGIRPVTEGLGRFQDTDAAVAERWQSRLAALAVPAGASLIPVVNP
ncbi:hypothetical protein ACFVWX_06850 [Streptomyces sp. NPDC058220]|uniref:hypothetical protein n=1 Tax=Streptomyces sp. NPDC058220 TaxID=3346387 RepID=UPI0036EA3F10